MTQAEGVRRRCRVLLCTLALLLPSSHGLAQAMEDNLVKDRFENFNRAMFAVNEVLDTYALRPVARGYDAVTPLPVRAGVGNLFANVGDVWNGANSALQGKFEAAGSGLARLLINSTLGIFGLFDVASEMGIERHDEDFGQTLAVWGVGDGPYLYLPVIGSRTTRDLGGWAVDSYVDPVSRLDPDAVRWGTSTLRLVDLRAGLLPADKMLDEAALDKYAYVRDAYLQRRRSLIYDGRPPRQDDY